MAEAAAAADTEPVRRLAAQMVAVLWPARRQRAPGQTGSRTTTGMVRSVRAW